MLLVIQGIALIFVVMRPWRLIFAIYLLLLSCIPCSDACGSAAELWFDWLGIEHEAHTHDEPHSDHGSCSDDHCSPFCVCNCCSIALNLPASLPVRIMLPPPAPIEKPTFYHQLSHSFFVPSIWQPPRVG